MKEIRLSRAVVILGVITFFVLLIAVGLLAYKHFSSNSGSSPTSVASEVVSSQPTQGVSEAPNFYPTPTRGLGISRKEIMDVYKQKGFTFEESSPVGGSPRVIGRATNGVVYLEIIGPPENVEKITMMFGVPSDAPSVVRENLAYVSALLDEFAAPGSGDWFINEIPKIKNGGLDSSKTFGNREAQIMFYPNGMAFAIIAPAP